MKLTEAQALHRVATYCSKAERAESDVRKKLANWELLDEEVSRIVSRLKKENYLNEERFCKSFVRDKMRFNKWGRNKIVFELKKKRVAESIIQSTLSELLDEDGNSFELHLMQILETKERSVKAKDIYDKRNKLLRFALGRGFTMEQSLKCVNKLLNTSADDEYF